MGRHTEVFARDVEVFVRAEGSQVEVELCRWKQSVTCSSHRSGKGEGMVEVSCGYIPIVGSDEGFSCSITGIASLQDHLTTVTIRRKKLEVEYG